MGIGFRNKVKVDLRSYPPYVLLAPKKFGKTTFWYKLVREAWGDDERGLLISCGQEEGYHSLDGLQVEVAKTWNDEFDEETGLRGFVQIVDDIVDNNDKYKLYGVCIDTLDTFIQIATKEVFRQHKKEIGTTCKSLNDAFKGYGRGKERLLRMCNEQVERLRNAGLAVFFLCHVKSKDKTDLKSGEVYEVITNNLTEDIFNNFGDSAQMVMVGTYDRTITDKKIESEERVVYLRGNSDIDAGGRFTHLPEKIHLDPKEFLQAFEEAVKAEMNVSIDDKEYNKLLKEEEKNRKKTAEIEKINTQKHIEEEHREELLDIIKAKFTGASDETKSKIRVIMKEYDFKKFSEENISIEALEKIVDLL